MLACLMKMLLACWRPVGPIGQTDVATFDRQDALLWYTDLSEHAAGDFSISVVQANSLLEDHSQVEIFSFGTFVGVYDGHGGPEAAKFVNNRLFQHVQNYASEQGAVSANVLQRAFAMTEAEFLARVEESWLTRPQMAAVGSCCLVGVISQEKLYVANLGDSRAVLGTIGEDGQLIAEQLSDEHNASYPEVRQELKAMHPDDPHIVVYKNGVWRVKGIIQVSRSVGDVYLKKAEYNREPLYAQFRLPQRLRRPVLLAEPTIRERTLRQEDKFVIFASDGLWEHLSNEDVVHIVHSHPRAGIARRLLKAALHVAARKREMRYADIRKIDRGVRRHFHDDITVVVLFIDYEKICTGGNLSPRSVRGGHISSNGEL